jgi:hypothetical protein
VYASNLAYNLVAPLLLLLQQQQAAAAGSIAGTAVFYRLVAYLFVCACFFLSLP